LNFSSYFQVSNRPSSSDLPSGSRIVHPVANNTSNNDNLIKDSSDMVSPESSGRQSGFFSRGSLPNRGNPISNLRKSEITAANIFTFQFPAKLPSLFDISGDSSSGAVSPITPNTSRNPVYEAAKLSKPFSPDSNINYPLSKDVLPKELIILDKNGKLFNSLEIFGLSTAHESLPTSPNSSVKLPSPPTASYSITSEVLKSEFISPPVNTKEGNNRNYQKIEKSKSRLSDSHDVSSSSSITQQKKPIQHQVKPLATPEHDLEAGTVAPVGGEVGEAPLPPAPSTSAIFQGGKFVKEECVICLADPKTVVLLPCRYCPCFSNLIFSFS
jgi:hypothetical protein